MAYSIRQVVLEAGFLLPQFSVLVWGRFYFFFLLIIQCLFLKKLCHLCDRQMFHRAFLSLDDRMWDGGHDQFPRSGLFFHNLYHFVCIFGQLFIFGIHHKDAVLLGVGSACHCSISAATQSPTDGRCSMNGEWMDEWMVDSGKSGTYVWLSGEHNNRGMSSHGRRNHKFTWFFKRVKSQSTTPLDSCWSRSYTICPLVRNSKRNVENL